LKAELMHITQVFISNGYPDKKEAKASAQELEETFEAKLDIDFQKHSMHHTILMPGRCSNRFRSCLGLLVFTRRRLL